MAYRIEYTKTPNAYHSADRPGPRAASRTAGVFLAFLLLVQTFWPDGQQFLRELLIPGDAETTIQAVEVFADELRCGEPFSVAAEVFCREILTDADLH